MRHHLQIQIPPPQNQHLPHLLITQTWESFRLAAALFRGQLANAQITYPAWDYRNIVRNFWVRHVSE